jgi:hypothetical protein
MKPSRLLLSAALGAGLLGIAGPGDAVPLDGREDSAGAVEEPGAHLHAGEQEPATGTVEDQSQEPDPAEASPEPSTAGTKPDAEALAKQAQNPVAALISVPFQNNTNFNVGPEDGTQNILNIQPVIPITLNKDWNLITRTILPVIYQPSLGPLQGSEFGLGDLQFSGFFSPRDSGNLIWGVGAIAQLPTHSERSLGNDNPGLGPTAVALHQRAGSPWVVGVLVNQVWSIDTSNESSYSRGLIQPFVNYNFEGGLYFTSAPIITANWNAPSGDRWTVPLGAGIGKIFLIGKQPVNAQLAGYYNVIRPDFGPEWQLRAQVQFLFPK